MTAKRISALFLILCLAAALSACGRTGKLYLPEDTASQNSAKAGEQQRENKITE